MKNKGLRIDGDGINVCAKQQGAILFMRNDVEKGDLQQYKIYCGEICLHFVWKSIEKLSLYGNHQSVQQKKDHCKRTKYSLFRYYRFNKGI